MRAVICAVLSFFVPGLGQAVVGRYRAMALWLIAGYAVTVAVVLSIWLLPLVIAVRISAMTSAFRDVRAAGPATRTSWVGGVLAVVLQGAIGYGIQTLVIEAFEIPSSAMAPTIAVGDHVLVEKLSPRLRGVARGDVIVFRPPCLSDRVWIKRVVALAGQTVEVRCNRLFVDGVAPVETPVQAEGCTYDDRDEGDTWHPRTCSEYAETIGARTYHVFHDDARPARDAATGERTGDPHDFPRLGDDTLAPSCASSGDSDASPLPSQQPGAIVDTKAGAGACTLQRHYVVPPGHVFVMGDNRSNSNDSRYWGSVPLELVSGRAIGIWWSRGASGVSLARFGAIP